MLMQGQSVLVIGTGNMGSSLVRGLCHNQQFLVKIFDIHSERLRLLSQELPVSIVPDLSFGATGCAAVVLCVKPQDLLAVAEKVKGYIPADALLISILAGVTIADLSEAFQFQGSIVRAMPNIAANVGAAATAMACNASCKEAHKLLAQQMFGCIGEADWIKESLLDAVTGLSGSGPAYIYMVIEALTDGGVKMGIPRTTAAKLAAQTVFGAAKLVKETGLHPAILREQVTTPAGTTINALHELEERGLRSMLIAAVEVATKRAAFLRAK